jgi:hypothetical protein
LWMVKEYFCVCQRTDLREEQANQLKIFQKYDCLDWSARFSYLNFMRSSYKSKGQQLSTVEVGEMYTQLQKLLQCLIQSNLHVTDQLKVWQFCIWTLFTNWNIYNICMLLEAPLALAFKLLNKHQHNLH